MLGVHDLPLFVLSGFLLNLTPGADNLYIAARAAASGLKAGVAAALGVIAGCSVHVMAATVGLSAILASSATAFAIVKWLGAAYLVYMGAVMLLAKPGIPQGPTQIGAPLSLGGVFARGLLTNLLNPKVALFFLAFLPQFIEASASSKPLAFLFLGAVFTGVSLVWCLLVAWLAAQAGQWRVSQSVKQGLQRGVGLLFVGLGARLALSER